MSNIEWILIIITIFLVILLFRYIQLKKQIRNLADQVNELNSGNSQQMLDISLIDKDLERLAGILNQYNIRQRQAVAGVLRNEEYLKESVANISHDLRCRRMYSESTIPCSWMTFPSKVDTKGILGC